MQVGLIGLGKMGFNLAQNLMDHGHQVVANDVNKDQVQSIADAGATPAFTLDELVKQLKPPRTIWVMVPAGEITEKVLEQLAESLDEGDRVIDGGNSNYKDSLRRSETEKEKGVFF